MSVYHSTVYSAKILVDSTKSGEVHKRMVSLQSMWMFCTYRTVSEATLLGWRRLSQLTYW